MFAVVLQYKLPSIAEAKMASANLSEALGGKIATFDIHGLNIMLGKDGEVSVTIRFEEAKMLRKFKDNMDMLLEDIKAAFVFKENKFFGVSIVLSAKPSPWPLLWKALCPLSALNYPQI